MPFAGCSRYGIYPADCRALLSFPVIITKPAQILNRQTAIFLISILCARLWDMLCVSLVTDTAVSKKMHTAKPLRDQEAVVSDFSGGYFFRMRIR